MTVKSTLWQNLRIGRFFELRRLFVGLRDVVTYRRCNRARAVGKALPIRVKGLLAPLWCRPGTSDAQALWDTFGPAYHRPPMPLADVGTVIDLGANVGYTAVDFANRWPHAQIIAVELDAANADLARRNLDPYGPRCSVVHAGVSVHSGMVTYGGTREYGFRVLSDRQACQDVREAPTITMDALLDRFSLHHVDFLKMDIEGAEASVVTPGARWLRQVGAMMMEWHPPARCEAMAAALSASGFNVQRVVSHPRGLWAWKVEGCGPAEIEIRE